MYIRSNLGKEKHRQANHSKKSKLKAQGWRKERRYRRKKKFSLPSLLTVHHPDPPYQHPGAGLMINISRTAPRLKL
ncbi:hypothetical protein MGG_14753 [Pyricularia oryzae 70-15]|uniref:Uncharacterized protein n=1 Tax=Pyricularia oryzae (strain 70-15 / ATCC MYA-4617 / FGSC 8958) TaxID=242507 RepID=G4MUA1_PYRO7|nr:uncharacterized protein MGG_14753 [Pyricularia oryzae 70-15]EHA53982.1 hypothetical protein MGG_14753 [Pyricularia oryzae 70-15]